MDAYSVTKTDLLQIPENKWNIIKIHEIMTKELITTTEKETLAQALEKMINYGIGRLLVVDSEKNLKGIISRTDIGMALRRYRKLSETQN